MFGILKFGRVEGIYATRRPMGGCRPLPPLPLCSAAPCLRRNPAEAQRTQRTDDERIGKWQRPVRFQA
jgi:hypothetical protein